MKNAIIYICTFYLLCFYIEHSFAQEPQHSYNYFVVIYTGDTININFENKHLQHISEIKIDTRDTSYLNLTAEDRAIIKKEVMRHHVEYMEYFHSDNPSAWRRQQRLCRELKNEFVDYHEIFQSDQYYTKNSLADSALLEIPEVFLIRPYNSVLYSSIKYYPPKIPDTLQKYKIWFYPSLMSVRTLLRDYGYYFDENIFPFIPEDIHLAFNDEQHYIKFIWVFRSFNMTTTNNATCNLMKVQYIVNNKIYENYICYSKDGYIAPRNIFKFNNNLQLNSYLYNNFSPVEQPFQYHSRRGDFITFPKTELIDYESLYQAYEKGEFEKFTGLIDLANLIAGDFIPTWANGNVIDYKDGYYTVEVAGQLNSYCEDVEKCCKTLFSQSHLSTNYTFLPIQQKHIMWHIPTSRQLVLRFSKLCSNPEKEIPWRMHIKINPETGNVKLKIVEMLDISNMPWCPN